MKELLTLSVAEISQKLHAREVSAVELTEAVLTHISETEPKVQAFITPTPRTRAGDGTAGAGATGRGRAHTPYSACR
jgi:Asp-tRNA(Asn)/Glu-tRNA(Gln) amidotransferase A subunit family amidase